MAHLHRDNAHEQTAKIVASIKLGGDEALRKKLNALPDKVLRRVVPKASELATDSVLADARRMAAEETGLLKESLGKKPKLYRRSGTFVTIVGPRTGFKRLVKVFDQFGNERIKYRNPVKYAHLVEKGTKAHSIKKKATGMLSSVRNALRKQKHPGATAKPFIEPAYDKNKTRIVSIFRGVIAEEVIKEAVKGAGK